MSRAACLRSFLAVALLGCGGAASPPPDDPGDVVADAVETIETPSARLPSDVVPTRYALTLSINPAEDAFTGVASIDVRLPSRRSVVHLHADGLDVAQVMAAAEGGEASEARWELADEEHDIAAIHFAEPLGPGVVTLEVRYGAPFDTTLEGLYRVEHDGDAYAFTQMEPLGARKAFPCFDEPSFKTPWDLTLVVPEGQTAVANAPATGQASTTGGMQRVHFQTTEPLPTYLVAFAVGPFDVVAGEDIAPSAVRDRPLPFRAIAARGQGEQLAHAIEHTPAILAALETYFGIPYPYAKLDIVAVPDFSAGAMENAGLVTFRDSLLLLGEDPPVGQQRGFAYVMAHELAHQWFGNLVTMQWWDDLWLNEAFANWMEARTIESTFPEFVPDVTEMRVVLSAMDSDSLAGARQIRQPIESEHDIHNAFDGITYNKGNAVLAMFERYLGREVFQRGVQRYLREHAGGNATAENLFDAIGAEAGRDVRPAFESFLLQPGVPLVTATPQCGEDGASLALTQRRYTPLGSSATASEPWRLPVCVRYAAGGETHRTCTSLDAAEGSIALEGCPEWVMPNAEGAGYYRWTMPPASLEALRNEGLGALTVREAMSFVDSTRASFAAGAIGFSDALAALAPLASREERALATAPMGLIEFALSRVLTTEAERTRARRFAARLYRSRARALGWTVRDGEDPETQLLRNTVLSFMSDTAEDAATRREANRRGRRYLGVGEDGLDADAVAPDLAGLAVRVALQEGDASLFDLAVARHGASTDPIERRNLLSGLGATADAALTPRVLDLTLGEQLRTNELFSPLMGQFRDRDTREAAWGWFTEHYDALSTRMGPGMSGYLPYAGSNFCSAERATEVQGFFAPRMESTQGGPRNLALAVERIQLCAAKVTHARGSVEGAF
ncbi:MAG: M1 family metallopeptidase [Sandaracinaceae bacterium]